MPVNKDFEYNGFATDWIGFQFKRDDRLWTVVKEIRFREYQVTYPGSGNAEFSAEQDDLMNEYIKQLEEYIYEHQNIDWD